jgi:hypothetical protein
VALQRSARRSDAPEPVMHMAISTITEMSRPVCGRLELLDDDAVLDELGVLLPLELVPLEVPPLELPLLEASTVTLAFIDGWIEQM